VADLPGGRFLPRDPRVEEPYRLTPKAAARIAMFGVVAVVLFALLFFRLWALQVISGDKYLQTANDNQVRTYRIQPPRGPILDRDGEVLVSNVPGTIVQLWPSYTDGRLDDVVAKLSDLLEVPERDIRRQVRALRDDPLTPIVVKTNVHDAKASYIREHQSDFPGVEVASTQLRRYEQGSLAAHLLGYVGEVGELELARLGEGYAGGDRIGKAGVERAYDTYLRGQPGVGQVRVNSLNEVTSAPTPSQLPKPGYAVRLTIDLDLQRAAENAIRTGIELARETGSWAANGGAIVAMDPIDGAIYALASNPSYDPSVFAGAPSQERYDRVFGKDARALNYPALNRAIAGEYPAGSTFKPVTALAALAEGLIGPDEFLQCDAERIIDGQRFRNWDPYVNEAMELTTALARSCDTYFYDVGTRFYELEKSPLQAWSRKLGFGSPTGIELGPEEDGLMPTPEWLKKTYANPIDQQWTSGDSVQLAIGQGHMTVTPLQLTRFYALLANGGKLVHPHLVEDVEQPASSRDEAPVVLRSFEPPPAEEVQGMPEWAIRVVQEGLYEATHEPYGTAYPIFGGYDVAVAGKTGTAEMFVQLPPGYLGLEDWDRQLRDQAWFCGYGPTDATGALVVGGRRPLVVCALIENGGHGGEVAAPAALQVFAEWWGVEPPAVLGEINSD